MQIYSPDVDSNNTNKQCRVFGLLTQTRGFFIFYFTDWSAYFREYHSVNGILQPKILQYVWHYADSDVVYFNENESPVTISYK